MIDDDDTYLELLETLRTAQRLGILGPGPVERAVEHARRFVDAIPVDATSIVDLGSGGGVPGLVVAWLRPAATVTLVDRRGKRTDALARAVRRLGWSQRVDVLTADIVAVARGPQRGSFDAATARGFLQRVLSTLRVTAVEVVTDAPRSIQPSSRNWCLVRGITANNMPTILSGPITATSDIGSYRCADYEPIRMRR